eukprot:6208372-Pleurochrysis_carterae.AAC.1
MSELDDRLKVGAKESPLRELLKYERSPFCVTGMRYKRDIKAGRIFSFPRVDMGNLDVNMKTALSILANKLHKSSRLGWEPRYKPARYDRKCTMALSMFIAGPVVSLATDLRL